MSTVLFDRVRAPELDAHRRVDAAAALLLAALVTGSALELAYAIGQPDDLPWYRVVSFGYVAVGSLVVAVVARAVLRHDHRHPVGWLLGGLSMIAAISVMTNGWTAWELPGSPILASLLACGLRVAVLLLAAALLLFPTGRPVSARWGWLVWACGLVAVVSATAAVFAPWPYPPYPNDTYFEENPLAVEALEGVSTLGELLGFPLVLAGFASLIVRYRRAVGLERDQLKVLTFAGVAVVVIVLSAVGGIAMGDLDSTSDGAVSFVVADGIFNLGVAALGVAIGVGIVRYRLYGLDRLMSRALAYVSMIVVLGTGYALLVAAITTQVATAGSVALNALGAALAAAAFQPVRAAVERGLERRIFRSRATSYDVMDRVARELSATPTSATVLDRIAEAAREVSGARRVRIVFERHDGTQLTATAGARDIEDWDPPIPLLDGVVRLGELSISGGDVGPSARAALDQVTSVATAALAAMRLHHELDELYAATQVGNRELAASQQRLIDAEEHERQELQRLVRTQVDPDLHELRRMLATVSPDEPGCAERLVARANRVAESVRSLARGVLPSVLVDHGLVAAVRADLRRFGGEVTLDVSPDLAATRLDVASETAAYLCCRAVVGNAGHQPDRPVVVHLGVDQGCLRVAAQFSRDGAGQDVVAPALVIARDRVLSLGGTADVLTSDGLVGLAADIPLALSANS